MINKPPEFCFSISYIELAANLETSIKGFKMLSENKLEERIVQYTIEAKTNDQLLFFEPELEVNVKRDTYYHIRPPSETSYLVFTQSISGPSFTNVENECLSIAESIGTNGFILLKNKAPCVAFLKKIKGGIGFHYNRTRNFRLCKPNYFLSVK
ncbi:hypothetical protein GQR36_26195 [Enterococcus termitis]